MNNFYCQKCTSNLVEVSTSVLYGTYFYCDECKELFQIKLTKLKKEKIDKEFSEGRYDEMKFLAKTIVEKSKITLEDLKKLNRL